MLAKSKYVYLFGDGKADGSADMKELLGGKGANIAEMVNLGIPVPAGFTITTEVCNYYYYNNKKYPVDLRKEVDEALRQVERYMGSNFGDINNPLLLSVRSGARVSMPGMMDTVLNIGLNDITVDGLIRKTGNERFVYDAYRRFVNMYGDVVMGVKSYTEKDIDPFEEILLAVKKRRGVLLDVDLTVQDLKELVCEYKNMINSRSGQSFPEDPVEQLWGSINAVFDSWNIPRAIAYRQIHQYPEHWGTAANIQAMVFGNMGNDSATGVAFTRDPANGDNYFYGEYLINAQGEDVVAGIRTPQSINKNRQTVEGVVTLEEEMPDLYKQLLDIRNKLEKHYHEMQDIEFTIQQGKLWMLQTRRGKRTAVAAIKIAVDMVAEQIIDKQEAIIRVTPEQVEQLLHPTFDSNVDKVLIAKGLPASPGAAVGQVIFSAAEAEVWSKRGIFVILVRTETSPDDIRGMNVAEGILTSRGGMTSHAAVVARGMGKCCIVGCSDLTVDYIGEKFITKKGEVVKRGDWISLDGSKGEVYLGKVSKVESIFPNEFKIFMSWVDKFRKLGVRTNADTPYDAEVARGFGAEGIGLCRTEHMFFQDDRIVAMRKMILASNVEERRLALSKIFTLQRDDFVGIFKAMAGFPVTIRTLDPPLHEFLPQNINEIKKVADELNIDVSKLESKINFLHEINPMLGHRGCRLGIAYPEITEMQVRAIFEAASIVSKQGLQVYPEIMIPLVSHINEFKAQKAIILKIADEVFSQHKVRFNFLVGTMIELPRAALTAGKIASEAQFFSFGTNDLTQTTFGLSRDDAGSFLPMYIETGILSQDPFITLDVEGVGKLIEIAVNSGRLVNQGLKIGICGEHGGDPASVAFCHQMGLNYVSCSPYRVPVARLAAAHVAIQSIYKDKRE